MKAFKEDIRITQNSINLEIKDHKSNDKENDNYYKKIVLKQHKNKALLSKHFLRKKHSLDQISSQSETITNVKLSENEIKQFDTAQDLVSSNLNQSNCFHYDLAEAEKLMNSLYFFRSNLSKDVRMIKLTGNTCLNLADFKELRCLVKEILYYYKDFDAAINKMAMFNSKS